MNTRWWHIVGILVIGYLVGYYFPMLGQATVAKVIPKTANG